MSTVRFTRTWDDVSDNRGFRFEFRCERCHSAYSSSSFPGDSRVAGARDQALAMAAAQMERDVFAGCAGCRQWVCGPRCFNHAAGACTNCRPKYSQQQQHAPQAVPAAQAQAPGATEAWAPDMRAELQAMLDRGGAVQRPAAAPQPPQEQFVPKFCSQCGSGLTGRFCGQCGRPAY